MTPACDLRTEEWRKEFLRLRGLTEDTFVESTFLWEEMQRGRTSSAYGLKIPQRIGGKKKKKSKKSATQKKSGKSATKKKAAAAAKKKAPATKKKRKATAKAAVPFKKARVRTNPGNVDPKPDDQTATPAPKHVAEKKVAEKLVNLKTGGAAAGADDVDDVDEIIDEQVILENALDTMEEFFAAKESQNDEVSCTIAEKVQGMLDKFWRRRLATGSTKWRKSNLSVCRPRARHGRGRARIEIAIPTKISRLMIEFRSKKYLYVHTKGQRGELHGENKQFVAFITERLNNGFNLGDLDEKAAELEKGFASMREKPGTPHPIVAEIMDAWNTHQDLYDDGGDSSDGEKNPPHKKNTSSRIPSHGIPNPPSMSQAELEAQFAEYCPDGDEDE